MSEGVAARASFHPGPLVYASLSVQNESAAVATILFGGTGLKASEPT